MASDIIMPKVAMAMNEGTITEWLLKDGDSVTKDEPLFSIETEKTTYEVEASGNGILVILKEEGDTVPCDSLIGYLAKDKAEAEELKSAPPPEPVVVLEEVAAAPPSAAPDSVTVPAAPVPPASVVAPPVSVTPSLTPASSGRVKVSPLAKKLAKEKGIDLNLVSGTGPGGRIKKRDLLAYEASAVSTTTLSTISAGAPDRALSVKAQIPVKGMRKAIRDGMMYAINQQAMCPGVFEIEMDALLEVRKSYLAREEEFGTRVSPQAFFMKALARAILDVPIINARLDGDTITVYDNVNIGVAVAVDDPTHDFLDGLIVPVIKNCDAKGIVQIDREFKALISKARAGQLEPADLSEGTVTISSVAGMLPGYSATTPILNSNQAYIGQPGNIVDRVVVKNGEMTPAKIMTWAYSFDHRVMDGVPACKFHTRLTEYLENPALMLA